mgnify:CR=1 FL=1
MIRLSKAQIIIIHEQLIKETGGASGLRDEGMLESALNIPFQTFGGKDLYPFRPSTENFCILLWKEKRRISVFR